MELIGSPEIYGTVIKVEGKRVRVDLSASGGKSSVEKLADELGPRGDGQVGRKQALFCGRDDGLLVAWFLEDLTTNNKPCWTVQAHSAGSAVSSIALIEDYNLLITAGADATVKVWDPWREKDRDKPLQALVGHLGGVCDVFYLADYIFSASADRTVRVWKRDEGRELLQYPWFSAYEKIAIGNSVEVWPMSVTAVMLRSLQLARLYVGSSVGEVFMFEKKDDFIDGEVDVSGRGKRFEPRALGAVQQGTGTAKMARSVSKLGVISLEALPADNLLIAITNDHAARVMDCGESNAPALNTTLTVSDTAARFVSGCWQRNQRELILLDEVGRIHIWNVFTSREVKKAKLFDVPCVGVSAPEGGQSRMLCVLPTHAEMWTAYREQKYNNLEGHEGPILTVVSLEEGPPRAGAEGKPGPVLKPEEHRIFSAGLDDTIRCWDPYDNCCLRTYKNDRSAEVSCMLYSKLHELIISGHEDGGVRLWNPDSGTCNKLRPSETDQKTENHQNMISCMTLGRLQKGGERWLLTADYDGRIGVFDLRKGRDAKPHLKCIHHSGHGGTASDDPVDLFAPAPHEILCMALGPRREWKKCHNVSEPETELLYTAGNDMVIRVHDERRCAAHHRTHHISIHGLSRNFASDRC